MLLFLHGASSQHITSGCCLCTVHHRDRSRQVVACARSLVMTDHVGLLFLHGDHRDRSCRAVVYARSFVVTGHVGLLFLYVPSS